MSAPRDYPVSDARALARQHSLDSLRDLCEENGITWWDEGWTKMDLAEALVRHAAPPPSPVRTE